MYANAPRMPTEEEEAEIAGQLAVEDGRTIAESLEDVQAAYVAVFDHYITDCPGYAGRVAAVVFSGAPEFVKSFCLDRAAGQI